MCKDPKINIMGRASAYALPIRRAVMACGLAMALISCGRNKASESFEAAARKQTSLDNMTLELFARSPSVDSGDVTTTAADDLESIPRTELTFQDVISVDKEIASSDIVAYESPSQLSAPLFYDWAGEFIPTTNSAFQAFMSYYHATKAKKFATTLFPTVDFSSATNPIFPLTLYYKEDGDITGTVYDPADKAIHLMYDSDSKLPNFHVADEADSVYHEFGHALQHARNSSAFSTLVAGFLDLYPYNRDLDSILEALADFYAAAVARDDAILPYLAANLPSFLDASSRTGTQYKRSLQNTLAFPDAYIRNAHLDGRVVAAALNDFRKLLAGEILRVPVGCTSCTDLRLSSSLWVDKATSYDRTLTLAYEAYDSLSSTSTFFQYATLLATKCASGNVSSWCSNSEISTALGTILSGRGLKPASLATNDAILKRGEESAGLLDATTPVGSPADITVKTIAGFMPFPNDTGFANADSTVDICEVMLLYPNIENTNATESMYDITVSIEAISGFTNLLNPANSQVVEPVTSGASRKVLGWLKPGETSFSMVDFYLSNPTSRWYTEQFGSYFAQKLSADYFPSELGWLVRAPSTRGATGSVRFKISFRRYNSTTIAKYQTAIFTQTLTTSSDTTRTGFCSN